MTEQLSKEPELVIQPDLLLESTDLSDETLIDNTEREEKLKKGIKIVIGGPPHSGKSVFIEALMQNVDKDNTFSFSAAPDGEGPWLQRHYDNSDVVKWRQKGKFTEEFVEDRRKKISEWEGPLMIIDVGGRTSEENSRMIEGATHAIILAGDLSKISEWKEFFEKQSIEVIAKLHSHYHGTNDLQLDMNPDDEHITSSIHRLERGEPASDRETIWQVASFIQDIVEGNKLYNEEHKAENINPFEVFLPKVFGDLPNEIIQRRIKLKDGSEKVVDNKQILRSAIPMIYGKAKEFDGQPVWLNGPVNSWEAIALASAFDDAGSEDIRLRGPDGYIGVKKLPQVEDGNTVNWNVMQQGEVDNKPVYIVHADVVASSRLLKPEELDTMNIPKLPEGSVVVISTQGPNWLKASIAAGYKDHCYAIAAFQPGEGSTIAWAEDKALLGKII